MPAFLIGGAGDIFVSQIDVSISRQKIWHIAIDIIWAYIHNPALPTYVKLKMAANDKICRSAAELGKMR